MLLPTGYYEKKVNFGSQKMQLKLKPLTNYLLNPDETVYGTLQLLMEALYTVFRTAVYPICYPFYINYIALRTNYN